MSAEVPMLVIENLVIEFGQGPERSRVVDGVSLVLHDGEVLGLAGESGSGKSMTALAIAGLPPPGATVTGSIRYRGEELVGARNGRLRAIRGREVGFVFQEPMASLHPTKRVGGQVAEAVRVHERVSRRQAREQAVELLGLAGIPNPRQRARQYPHELSGGLQQRVGIALALAGRPSLLIADEPTTALDTTVQAQVMDHLRSLQDQLGLAVLFISHDLALISEIASRVVVMYAGQIVEDGPISPVFSTPEHPYTELLLGAVIRAGAAGRSLPAALQQPLTDAGGGERCRFAFRCPYARERCLGGVPPLEHRRDGGDTRCIRHHELHLVGAAR